MRAFLIVLHVLGATVWTGGHLILAIRILPEALRRNDPRPVVAFESRYEAIGIPALIVQVLSGVWLAVLRLSTPEAGLRLDSPAGYLVGVKLLLLVSTVVLALQARLGYLPRVESGRLRPLARHVFIVTALAVGFVIVGVSLRFVDS
jgi:putative copper export protein